MTITVKPLLKHIKKEKGVVISETVISMVSNLFAYHSCYIQGIQPFCTYITDFVL